jgi:hypothetical protein
MIGKTLANLVRIALRVARIWSGQHWRSLTLATVVTQAAVALSWLFD